MTNAASLLFPCCNSSSKWERKATKTTLSSEITHLIASIVLAVVFGTLAALSAYYLTHQAIVWTLLSGGCGALLVGPISYVALRCTLRKHLSKTTIPTSSTAILPEERDGTGDTIETVRNYPGDLTKEQKAALTATLTNANTVTITFNHHPDFVITIRNQDLFLSKAQVLVNAANTHLGGGNGIDGLIHQNGGAAYVAEHRALQKKFKSHYVEGYAAIIESGELKAKHGIHNVIVVAGPQGETNSANENALFSCYFNSLELAHQQNKASIAFPAISTGIFGFPKDRAASISLRALEAFVAQYPDSPLKTISIHFLTQPELGDYTAAASSQ